MEKSVEKSGDNLEFTLCSHPLAALSGMVKYGSTLDRGRAAVFHFVPFRVEGRKIDFTRYLYTASKLYYRNENAP